MSSGIDFAKMSKDVDRIQKVRKIIDEAEFYPPMLRLAVKLHIDGVTEKDWWTLCGSGMFEQQPDHMINKLANYLRDVERGSVKITKRLRELAELVAK